MALKSCPECKKDLSSTVDKCIHCGCEVVLCPECEEFAIKGVENCPYCGASLENLPKLKAVSKVTEEAEPVKVKEKQSNGGSLESLNDFINGWKQSNFINTKFQIF